MNEISALQATANTKEKISSNAIWAGLISLFLIASTSSEYRLRLAGLLVHPYLIAIPVAIIVAKIKVFDIPSSSLRWLLAFYVFFSVANLPNDNPLSEAFKLGGTVATFLFFAQAIKTEKDFEIVSYGFIICAIYVAYKAVMMSGSGSRLAGINALEGLGNKNAQSLYTLPGLFLASIALLRNYERRNILQMTILGGGIFILMIGLVLSANRSGWVGALVVFGFMVIRMGVSFRTILIGGVFVVMGYFAVMNFAADIVEHKMNKTTEGYGSDNKRVDLIVESLRIGIEHPFFGVGLDKLRIQLAERLETGEGHVDPHNVYGFLLGAGGIFTFSLFFLFLLSLMFPVKLTSYTKYFAGDYKKARVLMVGIIVLFLIRAVFTREILYNPNFIGSIGLLYSYLLFYSKKMNDEQYNYYLNQSQEV
jgi:hypothetical protein